MLKYLANREIYEQVICGVVTKAERQLWIATADIKDMHVEHRGGKMVPFLKVLNDLLKRNVEVRLIHAKEPGENFRRDFDRFPGLWEGLERMLCPRVHFKCMIVDCRLAYFGSANLTGAGMGAKSEKRRNFENGILTDQSELVSPLIQQFDDVWACTHCHHCGRREYCQDCPIE